MENRMYHENRKSLNAFVGCNFDCVYCRPSFQRQAKRQKQRCGLCYSYTPHFHPSRLLKAPPKTLEDGFIFFPSMGDVSFAEKKDFEAMLSYTEKYPNTTFLIQTKNPECLEGYDFPDNVILALTLETNLRGYNTPSLYTTYERISKAPIPIFRFQSFKGLKHRRKIVTVEPILQFSDGLKRWIFQINPEAVYVGYDNHNCKLPEPTLNETKVLIRDLSEFLEVRTKTIRNAWFE